jgi:hypothetical protein
MASPHRSHYLSKSEQFTIAFARPAAILTENLCLTNNPI